MSLLYTRDRFTFNYITTLIRFAATLREKVKPKTEAFSIAKADIELPPIQVKVEYIIYLTLYGTPVHGTFDEGLLEKIRKDFNL